MILVLLAASIGVQPTPFCDLARDPERYKNQTVTTRASYVTSKEGAFLYDLQCNGWDSYAELRPACDVETPCDDVWRTLWSSMASDRAAADRGLRSDVRLTGQIQGWDGQGYGMGGQLRLVFRTRSIESVSRIPRGVGWPDRVPRQPAPFTDSVRDLRDIDAKLCSALAAGAKDSVAALTTEEYVLTHGGPSTTRKDTFLDNLQPLCPPASNPWCTTSSVDIRLDIGATVGILACATPDGLEGVHGYTQSFVRKGRAWRALRIQVLDTDTELAELSRKVAGQLVSQLSQIFDAEHEWRDATSQELPEAYRASYDQSVQELAAMGFTSVGFRQNLTLARMDPQNFPYEGLFVGADGTIMAQTMAVAGHQVVSFTSHLQDGRLVVTSNAEINPFSPPPGWVKRVLPFGTRVATLLAMQRTALRSAEDAGAHPIALRDLPSVKEAESQASRIFRAYRRSLGYLTRGEFDSLAMKTIPGKERLDLLWAEFQRQIAAHVARSTPH